MYRPVAIVMRWRIAGGDCLQSWRGDTISGRGFTTTETR
jgi:hypothetical protein